VNTYSFYSTASIVSVAGLALAGTMPRCLPRRLRDPAAAGGSTRASAA